MTIRCVTCGRYVPDGWGVPGPHGLVHGGCADRDASSATEQAAGCVPPDGLFAWVSLTTERLDDARPALAAGNHQKLLRRLWPLIPRADWSLWIAAAALPDEHLPLLLEATRRCGERVLGLQGLPFTVRVACRSVLRVARGWIDSGVTDLAVLRASPTREQVHAAIELCGACQTNAQRRDIAALAAVLELSAACVDPRSGEFAPGVANWVCSASAYDATLYRTVKISDPVDSADVARRQVELGNRAHEIMHSVLVGIVRSVIWPKHLTRPQNVGEVTNQRATPP